MKKRISGLNKLLLASSALVLAACGASDDVRVAQTGYPLGPYPNSCPPGQVTFNGQQCLAGTFQQNCYSQGGTLISGGNICKFSVSYPSFSANYRGKSNFPVLNPSYMGGAWHTLGMTVASSDTLELRSQSEWGEQSGFLGTSCDEKADGLGRDLDDLSTVLMNDGYPQGLMISNGTEIYASTTNSTSGAVQTITFGSTGVVRIGFNVPSGEGSCFNWSINSVRHTYCRNTSYAPVACP